jgi:hypothetical protein
MATTGSFDIAAVGHVAALLLFVAVGAAWGTRTFDRKLTQ